MKTIQQSFPINSQEYEELESKFGKLIKYEAWQLLNKNTKNNHTDDFEDINQELTISLLRAGAYYKRQVFIDNCFVVAKEFVKDSFLGLILYELEDLWKNKTRHGAHKQKFGWFQENLLENIVKMIVPKQKQPNKTQPLRIDAKFHAYCKAITWNDQKRLGKKITKEKTIRTGLCSLSEFDNLIGKTF